MTKRPVHGTPRLAKSVFAICAALRLSTGEPVDHRFSKRLEWRAIHSYLGLTGQESLCDIGCGDGNWTRRLASDAGLTVGVDFNCRVVRWAAVKTRVHQLRAVRRNRRFRRLLARIRRTDGQDAGKDGRNPSSGAESLAESPDSGRKAVFAGPVFVCSDAHRLPFATASFDRLASICSMEHFHDDMQTLHEMARILRPGGIAALTVDSLSHPQGPSGELLEQYRSRHSIRRCYRLADLEGMVVDSGFEVEESRYVVNSTLSNRLHLIWAKWDLQGTHVNWMEMLFPWTYWLALLSDSLFGLRDSGAFLAVKLRRTGRPWGAFAEYRVEGSAS